MLSLPFLFQALELQLHDALFDDWGCRNNSLELTVSERAL